MELSQEFLIDMAINAVGYLIVGILAVIMVSLYKKKKTTDIDTNKDVEVINELCLSQADIRTEAEELLLQPTPDTRYEFISLNSEPDQKKRIQKKEPKQLSQEIPSCIRSPKSYPLIREVVYTPKYSSTGLGRF